MDRKKKRDLVDEAEVTEEKPEVEEKPENVNEAEPEIAADDETKDELDVPSFVSEEKEESEPEENNNDDVVTVPGAKDSKEDDDEDDEDEEEKDGKFSKAISIVLLLIIIAIVCLIAWFLYIMNKPKANELTAVFSNGAHNIEYGTVINTDEESIEAALGDYIIGKTGDLSLSEPFTADKVGENTIYLVVSKKGLFGSKTENTVPLTVMVEDTEAPVITLSEEVPSVADKEDCLEGIESVIDNADGEIDLEEVEIDDSEVDYTKEGGYGVTATVKDSSGNEAEISYSVKVETEAAQENLAEEQAAAQATAPARDYTAEKNTCESNGGYWWGAGCEYVNPDDFGNHSWG